MKWLLLSDLQGVLYEDWISFLNMDDSQFDTIVTLGDIDILYLKSIAEKFSHKRIIGVLGNHDYKGDLEYCNIQNLHGSFININGQRIIGLEGCVRYKNEKDAPLYTQEEMNAICNKLPSSDIVISHNSPFGIHDKKDLAHQGYIGLRNYVEEHQPLILFHGHQHVHQITHYQGTQIVGIYGGWLWDQNLNSFIQVLKVVE